MSISIYCEAQIEIIHNILKLSNDNTDIKKDLVCTGKGVIDSVQIHALKSDFIHVFCRCSFVCLLSYLL